MWLCPVVTRTAPGGGWKTLPGVTKTPVGLEIPSSPQPFPCSGLCCALPPPHPFLLLPKSTLGSMDATISSLSLRTAFPSPHRFCQWLCNPFPEPAKAQLRVEVLGCVFLSLGFSKSCFFPETPTRVPCDVSTGQRMALVGGKPQSLVVKLVRNSLDLLGTSLDLLGTSLDLLGTSLDLLGSSLDLLGISLDLLGPSGDLLGPSGELLGPSWTFWGPSWTFWGSPWTFLDLLGTSLDLLGISLDLLGPSGDLLGPSGDLLGPSGDFLGPSWTFWGPPWTFLDLLGTFLDLLGTSLDLLGISLDLLGPSGDLLGPSGDLLGPSGDLLGPPEAVVPQFPSPQGAELGGRDGEEAPAPLLERAAAVSSWQLGLPWAGGTEKEGKGPRAAAG
nr:uncharacterized protein LOC101234162 isoform X1 [Taeniopygia guttata]